MHSKVQAIEYSLIILKKITNALLKLGVNPIELKTQLYKTMNFLQ